MITDLLPPVSSHSTDSQRRDYYVMCHQSLFDKLLTNTADACLASELLIYIPVGLVQIQTSIALIKLLTSQLQPIRIMTLCPNFTLSLDMIQVPNLSIDGRLRSLLYKSLRTTRVSVLQMIGSLAILISERANDNYDELVDQLYNKPIPDLYNDPVFEIVTLAYYLSDI